MRILQIHNAYGQQGGEDTIVETEATLLESDGHQVERVRVTNPTGGIDALTSLVKAPRNNRSADAVLAQAEDFRPEVAHVHNTWFALTPEIFHRLDAAGIPVVMTLQNYRLLCVNAQLFRSGRVCTDCVGGQTWPGVRHRCYRDSAAASAAAAATIQLARYRGSFDRVRRFLAPSQFVKDLFVEAGSDPTKLFVRPNAVDDPGPRPAPPSKSTTILYAGRLTREKGLLTLLDGWRRSGLARRGYTLEVIGDGPLRWELTHQKAEGFHLVGWLPADQLRATMLRVRALVFPSEWYENFGRVIIEAMAAGLPVLSSDIATPAEIVGPLGPRWLVDPGEPAAWGRSLGGLEDAIAVDAAGLQARQLYDDHYTLDQGLRSLVAVYREVASVAS